MSDLHECIDKNGKKYRTVIIGGKIWMAENLDYKVEGYDNWPSKYGRLYTWFAAKEACNSLGNGWRLPTREEWHNLIEAIGNNPDIKLKAIHPEWDGTNESGFSALPSGYYSNGQRLDVGMRACWWAKMGERNGAMNVDSEFAWCWNICSGNSGVVEVWNEDRINSSDGYSVRCIKDS